MLNNIKGPNEIIKMILIKPILTNFYIKTNLAPN